MRVLITSEYNDGNSIIKSYVDGIRPFATVESSILDFWNTNKHFDIVHIQWPEQLFFWRLFDEEELIKLEERFHYWKERGTKIIFTRHNAGSHRNYYLDERLYHAVLKNADAIIHLGEWALSELKSDPLYSPKINAVINHPNYLHIVGVDSRQDAREKLGIENDTVVYLAFGTIRNQEEEVQLVEAFKGLKLKNKKLLIVKSLLLKNKSSFLSSPLKRMIQEFNQYLLRRNNIVAYKNTHIPETEIASYFMASDVVVIPRLCQLNSGLVYMAFGFSKIVVGPNMGNIGLVLEQTRNFLFEPGNVTSYTLALEKAGQCTDSVLGKSNFEYVVKNCDIKQIGRRHFELYERVVAHSG